MVRHERADMDPVLSCRRSRRSTSLFGETGTDVSFKHSPRGLVHQLARCVIACSFEANDVETPAPHASRGYTGPRARSLAVPRWGDGVDWRRLRGPSSPGRYPGL